MDLKAEKNQKQFEEDVDKEESDHEEVSELVKEKSLEKKDSDEEEKVPSEEEEVIIPVSI